MSDAYTTTAEHPPHPPHLAHHFETPEQQYATGKLGMWIFLGTEILMFGGLFCAYGVYRHNHPDVFLYAHQYLDKWLGGVNTLVLIASSFTMAWAVRSAQLNHRTTLIACLVCTLLGGFIFLGIKAVEYHHKWEHHLWIGKENRYNADYKGDEKPVVPAAATLPASTRPVGMRDAAWADPNAGTKDEAKVKPATFGPRGLTAKAIEHRPDHLTFAQLDELDRKRVNTFFSIYFIMTGLHGLHVIVGMSIIFWLLVRSSSSRLASVVKPVTLALIGAFLIYLGLMIHNDATLTIGIVILALGALWALLNLLLRYRALPTADGEFNDRYFTPVDVGGLYWHLVDLIWIFLFPLLYLIH